MSKCLRGRPSWVTFPLFIRGQAHITEFKPSSATDCDDASRVRPSRSQRVDIQERGWDLSEEPTVSIDLST
jgi:hypothetical protein